ncbi:MAG: HAMP domain-containing histidine kinase [Clostridiales bacterium]|nr:HAMP domain-containing histidine kinase [Clostridiales bacterium]
MIKGLRRKFIFIMMTMVVILLTAIFTSLYYSTKLNYEQESMRLLENAARDNGGTPRRAGQDPGDRGTLQKPGNESDETIESNDNLEMQEPQNETSAQNPGNRRIQPPPDNTPDTEQAALLIIDQTDDNEITIVQNRLLRYEEAEESFFSWLTEAVSEPSGLLKEQHLRYLRQHRPGGSTRYVFADTLSEEQALRWQLLQSLVIGLGAFAVFFLFTLILSRWITRPVEDAWNRQQQFVADASHELKTPLTVILANVNMLSQSTQLPTQESICVENIQDEAVRMKHLAENLLTLARSDSGHPTEHFSDIDLSYQVSASMLTFEPIAFEMGKSISGQIEETIHVNGNADSLRQLTDILLDNACKYSSPDSEIQVNLATTGKHRAVLTVTSSGTPLSDEEINHIFLRFYRADPSRGSVSGYGLGLSIAQTITAAHGGRIEAESDGKNRNTFRVTLPLA